MNIEELLKGIAPTLTVYFVAIALGSICFRIGKNYRNFERVIYENYLKRTGDIVSSFVESRLRPFILDLAGQALNVGFTIAQRPSPRPTASPMLSTSSSIGVIGPSEEELDENAETLEDQQASIFFSEERRKIVLEEFLSSKTGSTLISKLETLISQRTALIPGYELVKKYNRKCYVALFALGLLFFLGLVYLVIPWPFYVITSYINAIIVLIFYCAYVAVRQHLADISYNEYIESYMLSKEW
ncbi:MAG: hypothetical protein ABIH04_05205 [Planctomycetota bacterium]